MRPRLSRQVFVRQPHCGSPVANGGSNPLERPVTRVADRENAWYRGLERERRPVKRPARPTRPVSSYDIAAGQNVTMVGLHRVGQPLGPPSPRTSMVTCRARRARCSAVWPAEFPAPTTKTSRSSMACVSLEAAP